MASATDIVGQTKTGILDAAGGPARLQIIAVLGATLGLDTAEQGTVAAVSDQLKDAFHIGNTEIGLLIAVVSFIGAVATLPVGVLADRIQRRTILLVAVSLWAAAMVICGTATSYGYLLVTRLFLGAVTAAAWPCIASLTGDFFRARERAAIYGLILSGEMIGIGVGFFIAGEVSTLLGWRWAFFVMALPAVALVWIVWRFLPEPARGGQRWLQAGETDPDAASTDSGEDKPAPDNKPKLTLIQKKVLRSEVEPRQSLVLKRDPTRRSWFWAVSYLLQLPSYLLLIAASTLAYFFFAGIRAFAMIYFTHHYHLPRGGVSALVFVLGAGAIAGLVVGGRVSERPLRHSNLAARVTVPALALFAAVPFFGLAVWVTNPWLAVPLLTIGAGVLAAAVAPIDAARLDILHPRLWGRGESGRMALRSGFEGAAPLLFGAVSGWLGGGDQGLMYTLLIMLIPMLAAGLLVLPGRQAYLRDMATAAASVAAATGKRK